MIGLKGHKWPKHFNRNVEYYSRLHYRLLPMRFIFYYHNIRIVIRLPEDLSNIFVLPTYWLNFALLVVFNTLIPTMMLAYYKIIFIINFWFYKCN